MQGVRGWNPLSSTQGPGVRTLGLLAATKHPSLRCPRRRCREVFHDPFDGTRIVVDGGREQPEGGHDVVAVAHDQGLVSALHTPLREATPPVRRRVRSRSWSRSWSCASSSASGCSCSTGATFRRRWCPSWMWRIPFEPADVSVNGIAARAPPSNGPLSASCMVRHPNAGVVAFGVGRAALRPGVQAVMVPRVDTEAVPPTLPVPIKCVATPCTRECRGCRPR
jgi:hypothetical protein